MSTQTAPGLTPQAVEMVAGPSNFWWLRLITGVLWVIASLVILQFNHASITTIGVIIGCMFLASSIQQLALAFIAPRLRWLWGIFSVLFLICAITCFANPHATFATFADILGFLFLTVGVWWTIQAFVEREVNPLWWLGLISGILMLILAFWTSGQFYIQKAYTLLVFAGIWALMHGTMEIVRAFGMRSASKRL
jgi:uncharacterized membrane protein HdeD (DUF308 family)